jgi:transposase-like protein
MKHAENQVPSGFRRGFVPRDLLAGFGANFLDLTACRQWVIHRLHPGEKRCPSCKAKLGQKASARFLEGGRVCCANCRRHFDALSETPFSGMHWDYRELVLLTLFLGLNLNNKTIAACLGCDEETVRIWRHRYRAIEARKGSVL